MLISYFRAASAALLLGGFAAGAVQSNAATVLIDFGGDGRQTTLGVAPDDPINTWNNVTATIGRSSTGSLSNLSTTTNVVTDIDLFMISRFNNANDVGTQDSTLYPDDATRDSLFGNTGVWEGLSNVFPSFKLSSLDTSLAYDLTFYASRTGATDNRETLYTVEGLSIATTALNAANNIDNSVTLFGVVPSEAGEITISLSPGPNNTNAGTEFTYLGVLQVESIPEPSSAMLLLGGGALLGLRRRSRS